MRDQGSNRRRKTMIEKRVLVLGGDERMSYVATLLEQQGNEVVRYKTVDIDQAQAMNVPLDNNYDMVIGPIPLSRDGIYLNVPPHHEKIVLKDLFSHITADLFIGCKVPKELGNQLRRQEIKWVDILERDDFAIDNALPTAEGAIQLAMELTPFTLTHSKCLVLGFGRCGKVLAQKLDAMGAKVTVEARKHKDLAFIRAYGYEDLPLSRLKSQISQYQIIFNTIPYKVLDKEMLGSVNAETLIIDLASKPGGTDFQEAKARNIQAVLALGLPGKCAPRTASEIIIRCIENIIQ